MDDSKKYKLQGIHPHPNLGKLIERKLKERRLTKAEVSRRLGITPSVFQQYIKQESVQFGVLWKIGIVIEYNFFAGLMEYLPEHILNSAQSSFQKTIAQQADEIADLKKEIEIYKGILKK